MRVSWEESHSRQICYCGHGNLMVVEIVIITTCHALLLCVEWLNFQFASPGILEPLLFFDLMLSVKLQHFGEIVGWQLHVKAIWVWLYQSWVLCQMYTMSNAVYMYKFNKSLGNCWCLLFLCVKDYENKGILGRQRCSLVRPESTDNRPNWGCAFWRLQVCGKPFHTMWRRQNKQHSWDRWRV